MKALDARNATARRKQLESKDPQPYHKQYIEIERTCPHCDKHLQPAADRRYWVLECDCSYWTQSDHPASFRWTREPKTDPIEAARP